MNPQKRFGQIEEVLAELLMKVDRIADNGGMTLDLAVNTDAEVKDIKQTVGRIDGDVTELKQTVGRMDSDAKELKQTVGRMDRQLDSTARAVATSTVQNSKNFQEIKDQIAGIKSEFSEFKQTQQDILTLLKEKLG
jgi:methyl-accepting chemotaxis protein